MRILFSDLKMQKNVDNIAENATLSPS